MENFIYCKVLVCLNNRIKYGDNPLKEEIRKHGWVA